MTSILLVITPDLYADLGYVQGNLVMHNGVIPVLELEGVELPQSTFYSNIPYADSTVNILGQYVLSDLYLVVHLKHRAVCTK